MNGRRTKCLALDVARGRAHNSRRITRRASEPGDPAGKRCSGHFHHNRGEPREEGLRCSHPRRPCRVGPRPQGSPTSRRSLGSCSSSDERPPEFPGPGLVSRTPARRMIDGPSVRCLGVVRDETLTAAEAKRRALDWRLTLEPTGEHDESTDAWNLVVAVQTSHDSEGYAASRSRAPRDLR